MKKFILPSIVVFGLLCLSFTNSPDKDHTWINTENVHGLKNVKKISLNDFNDLMDNTYIGQKTTNVFHHKICLSVAEDDVTKTTDPAGPPDTGTQGLIDNIISKYK